MDAYRTEIITTPKGNKFKVEYAYDDTGEAPWQWDDRHGQVSDWTSRDKKPGEIILCVDHPLKRYYDMQGAIETAREEGWSCEGVLPTDTAGQKAVKAAQADYKYLKAWCADDWWYACLRVVLLDADGEERDIYEDYLGGVEDGYYRGMNDYSLEAAMAMALELECTLESDESEAQTNALHSIKDDALYLAGII